MSDETSWLTGASQLLVAFTIEVDNEFEHRMPHRTALSRAAGIAPAGPWLASLAMWATFMKFVPPAGITVAELRLAARTKKLQLDGMRRWGYVTAETADGVRIDSPKMRADTVLRPTKNGRAAAVVWAEVVAEVEGRWMQRFGRSPMQNLRSALTLTSAQRAAELPEYLPVVGYGFWSGELLAPSKVLRLPEAGEPARSAEPGRAAEQVGSARLGRGTPRGLAEPDRPAESCRSAEPGGPGLATLLSRSLLEFTLIHEPQSPVSLVISENVLPILGSSAVPTRDIAGLTGIGTATSMGMIAFLVREGYAVVGEASTPKRTKAVALTPLGERMKAEASVGTTGSEDAFARTFGEAKVDELRAAVWVIHGHPALAEGMRPYPDGWRAAKPFVAHTNDLLADPRHALPRYPVVTHRGGYPDGS